MTDRLKGQTYMSRYKTGEEIIPRKPERMRCNYCKRVKDSPEMAYQGVCADCYYDPEN